MNKRAKKEVERQVLTELSSNAQVKSHSAPSNTKPTPNIVNFNIDPRLLDNDSDDPVAENILNTAGRELKTIEASALQSINSLLSRRNTLISEQSELGEVD